jgi:hypothetical protein
MEMEMRNIEFSECKCIGTQIVRVEPRVRVEDGLDIRRRGLDRKGFQANDWGNYSIIPGKRLLATTIFLRAD